MNSYTRKILAGAFIIAAAAFLVLVPLEHARLNRVSTQVDGDDILNSST